MEQILCSLIVYIYWHWQTHRKLGAMNRLKEWKFLSPEAKWRLAAAYQLIGQTKVALQLISGLPTSFPARQNPGLHVSAATCAIRQWCWKH